MPPPVIAFFGLRAEQLAGIAGDIVFVEHSLCLGFFAFPCNNRGSLSGLTEWQSLGRLVNNQSIPGGFML
jgi:hypothetical protein